jgi:DNA polymerase-3 subunit beta
MKLLVTQENLSRALSTVGRIATARNSLPILANILLKTSRNRLEVSTTNLDIAISETIGAKVEEEGSITIPARLTQDFISNLPAGTLSLVGDENKVTIEADNYSSVINGMPADEFPVMPVITEKSSQQITIPFKQLKSALSQVLFTASSDETRPVLTGVYIHSHNKKLYMAATDSYRLAERLIEGVAIEEEVSLLLPASALQEVARVLHEDDRSAVFVFDEQQAKITLGDIQIVARRIEGKYPDYRKLLPVSFETSITLSKHELQSIAKVASLFARESAGGVVMKADEVLKKVSLRSIASQVGENTSQAEAVVEGVGETTLNSRYLLDAIQAISSEQVTIGMNGKNDPVVLSDGKKSPYLHLIMPVKS